MVSRYGRGVDSGCKLACVSATDRKTTKTHPALALYDRLFREAAESDTITAPDHFVETSVFQDRLAAEGIEHPENFIEFANWCEEIGLCAFAHRLIVAHHRKHGTQRDPSREAAYRFHRRRKKLGLP